MADELLRNFTKTLNNFYGQTPAQSNHLPNQSQSSSQYVREPCRMRPFSSQVMAQENAVSFNQNASYLTSQTDNQYCEETPRSRNRESSSISAHVVNLYKPYARNGTAQNYKPKLPKGKNKRPIIFNETIEVNRVFLMPSNALKKALRKQGDIHTFFENKLVAEKVQLSTGDNVDDVIIKLKEAFKGQISQDSFDQLSRTPVVILKDEGGYLHPPGIKPDAPLDGPAIKSLFVKERKKIYLRTAKVITSLMPDLSDICHLLSYIVPNNEDSEMEQDRSVANSEEDINFYNSDSLWDHQYALPRYEPTNESPAGSNDLTDIHVDDISNNSTASNPERSNNNPPTSNASRNVDYRNNSTASTPERSNNNPPTSNASRNVDYRVEARQARLAFFAARFEQSNEVNGSGSNGSSCTVNLTENSSASRNEAAACTIDLTENTEDDSNEAPDPPLQAVNPPSCTPDPPIQAPTDSINDSDVVMLLAAAVTNQVQKFLHIDRHDAFQSAILGLKSKNFDLRKKVSVQFTNETKLTEQAIDAGGPKNEFFTLALKELHQSTLFQGPDDQRVITLDIIALRKNEYLYAGQIIALCLANQGPGPSWLSEDFYNCILENDIRNRKLDKSQIFDADLRRELDELDGINDVKAFNVKLLACTLLVTTAGVAKPFISKISEKKTFMNSILYSLLILRVEPAFKQFMLGLGALDCLPIFRLRKQFCKKFFVAHQKKLTAKDFDALFQKKRSSAKDKVESRVIRDWQYYLDAVEDGDLTDGVSFEKILMFSTGCEREPPFGWLKRPLIYFMHDNLDPDSLPTAKSCDSALYLPVHYNSFNAFRRKMNLAVLHCNTLSVT